MNGSADGGTQRRTPTQDTETAGESAVHCERRTGQRSSCQRLSVAHNSAGQRRPHNNARHPRLAHSHPSSSVPCVECARAQCQPQPLTATSRSFFQPPSPTSAPTLSLPLSVSAVFMPQPAATFQSSSSSPSAMSTADKFEYRITCLGAGYVGGAPSIPQSRCPPHSPSLLPA